MKERSEVMAETCDAATFSRDLELAASGMTLPLSSAPGYKGDPTRLLGGNPNGSDAVALIARATDLIARAHDGCFIAHSVSTAVTIEPVFAFAAAAPLAVEG